MLGNVDCVVRIKLYYASLWYPWEMNCEWHNKWWSPPSFPNLFFWIGYNLRRDMISVFKSFLKWTDIMMPLTLHSSISPLGKKAIKMFPGPHIYQGPRKWMERLSICFYIAGQSRTRLDAWIVRMRRRRWRKKNQMKRGPSVLLCFTCSAAELHKRFTSDASALFFSRHIKKLFSVSFGPTFSHPPSQSEATMHWLN